MLAPPPLLLLCLAGAVAELIEVREKHNAPPGVTGRTTTPPPGTPAAGAATDIGAKAPFVLVTGIGTFEFPMPVLQTYALPPAAGRKTVGFGLAPGAVVGGGGSWCTGGAGMAQGQTGGGGAPAGVAGVGEAWPVGVRAAAVEIETALPVAPNMALVTAAAVGICCCCCCCWAGGGMTPVAAVVLVCIVVLGVVVVVVVIAVAVEALGVAVTVATSTSLSSSSLLSSAMAITELTPKAEEDEAARGVTRVVAVGPHGVVEVAMEGGCCAEGPGMELDADDTISSAFLFNDPGPFSGTGAGAGAGVDVRTGDKTAALGDDANMIDGVH